MLITVIDFNGRCVGAISNTSQIPGYLPTFTGKRATGYRPGVEQLIVIRVGGVGRQRALRCAVGVQVGELVPGGQGRRIELIDAATELPSAVDSVDGGGSARCDRPIQN